MGEEKNGCLSCEACGELLYDYVSDMLDETQRALVEGHIAACPHCTQELEEIKAMLAVLSAAPAPELPEDFHAVLHDKLIAAAETMEFKKPKMRERLAEKADVVWSHIRDFVTRANWRIAAPVMLGCVLVISVFSTGLYQWMKAADDMLIEEETPTQQEARSPNDEEDEDDLLSPKASAEPAASSARPSAQATAKPSARATDAPSATTAPRTTARPSRSSSTSGGTTARVRATATPRPQATSAPRTSSGSGSTSVSVNESSTSANLSGSGSVSVNESASANTSIPANTEAESSTYAAVEESAPAQQAEEAPVSARAEAAADSAAAQDEVMLQSAAPVSGGSSNAGGGSGGSSGGGMPTYDFGAAAADTAGLNMEAAAYHISVYALESYLDSFPFAENVKKDDAEGIFILDLTREEFQTLYETVLTLGADVTLATPEEEERAASLFGEPEEDSVRIWFSEKTD